ncbi:MAG: methionine gamma-lyase family protein [Clostridiales bacterium]|jgi:cystathionine beta-lyase family protein involved in aluminum resistance|nr:methionine gamma-lyase family protein [Clostridiales bacterium]
MQTLEALKLINDIENRLRAVYKKIDETALFNLDKVLKAFRKNRISQRHFFGSTGYGYGDAGRDALNCLFADITGSEAAIVSPYLASGTHALTVALFGLLRPNDLLLSITGKPYDTLGGVISLSGNGSLADYGIKYAQIDMKDGKVDVAALKTALQTTYKDVRKVVFLQRSKGYEWRDALSIGEIEALCQTIKQADGSAVIVVDNCYGEFIDEKEPTDAGADIIAGSLIKNPGGGLAPTGGYIAGKSRLVEKISYRLTAPSIGVEITSFISGYLPFYQGLFAAPTVVAAASKGAALMTALFDALGYETMPRRKSRPLDIITSIKFNDKDRLLSFMKVIQNASPVDGFATPEPWDMPGYEHQVVMAAGCFVGGASIELSADAPIKKPYIGYLQGGLTYEHVKIAALKYLETI